jgi:hypothetical protein
MRWLAAFVLVVASCTMDNPDYLAGVGDAPDLALTGVGDPPDLASAPNAPGDMSMPGAPRDMATTTGNKPCKTVCECPVGQICGFNGMCQKSSYGNLYCCGSTTCPSGQTCQDSGGRFGQCGGGNVQMPDMSGSNGGVWGVNDAGMGPFWCHFIPCMDDGLCKTSGCGYCDKKQKVCM